MGKKTDLSPEAKAGYWDILEQVERHFGLTYWGQGSRNGDPRFTGATVVHFHEQLVVADPQWKGDPVRLFLSSRPDANDPPPAA